MAAPSTTCFTRPSRNIFAEVRNQGKNIAAWRAYCAIQWRGVPAGSPGWRKAHPYIRRYLAIHAAMGGMLDDLATDPLFLVAAEPAGLKLVLTHCSSEEARRWVAVYSVAAHDLSGDLGERLTACIWPRAKCANSPSRTRLLLFRSPGAG
jgi:hypothetical protein